ncbi:glycosyltransferase family 39 protein, partial [candidate division KSB1 bacterium]
MKGTIKNFSLNKWIILIIIISAVVRFGAVFYLQNYKNPDTWEYGEIADNIIKGNGFSGTNFNRMPLQSTSIKAPVYPYILAFFLKYIPNPYLILQILQVFISLIAGFFLFLSAKEIFNKNIGYASFILYGIHPTFIYIPTQFLPLCIHLIQLGIGIYLLMKINENNKSIFLILFGINSGIALLTDTIFIMFIAASGIYWIFLFYNNKKEILKIFSIVFGITLFLISPWLIRNYKVHHQFVFIKSPFGYTLWRGNHLHSTGTARLPDGTNIDETMSEELKEKLKLPEYSIEINREKLFIKEAVNFINSHPSHFLKL